MDLGLTRRRFLLASAAALAAQRVSTGQPQAAQSARASVAGIDRDRILAEAPAARARPVLAPPSNAPSAIFANAVRDFSATVACLAAAFVLTKDAPCAHRAAEHLRAWLVDPARRLDPQPNGVSVVDLAPLAEVARALAFLPDSSALAPDTLDAINTWFAALLDWLNTDRDVGIERDKKDHRASAWLLLASAVARSQRDDKALDACRQRFRKPTLRNQVDERGAFPQELATPNPYRNTLYNFDLLAGACELLSSPFQNLWDYELIDGPGIRTVAAYLFPFIETPEKWPGVADAEHFRELPGRRPGLLFAGRAFNRPEYVALWQSLPTAIPEDIAASFPIRQPLLWTTRASHGF